MKMLTRSLPVLILLFGFQGIQPAFSEESFDRYAPVFKPYKKESTLKNIATHFPVYPFEIVRWPMDKTLVYIEKHHLDKKAQWVYDTIENQGITPKVNLISWGNLGGGADIDFVRLLRQKEHHPDLITKGWINWTHNVNFEVGSRVGMERIGGTRLATSGLFKYENRPEEHFYGLGPNTSAGDGTSYRMEATTLEPMIGFNFTPTHSADVKFGYRHINITNGEDGGRGIIDTTFPADSIPGLDGDDLLTLGAGYTHDTRNRKENSTTGSYARLGFSFNEGVGNSDARYFKYEIEGSRFLRLRSDRRVLALHVYAEHNAETKGHEVPFHQMAKLGGYGAYPRLSETLRGFDSNRFFGESATLFNIEYRYTIWEYRDFKVDSVIFFDEGQVFRDFDEFQFKDFRESYGLGFRLSLANHILLSIELAHGDEGTQFYAKTGAPF